MNNTHAQFEYMPCEQIDPVTRQPTGVWHFCCVTLDKMKRQLIFPVGYCRTLRHKDRGANACKHKSAQEALDCFRKYELDLDTKLFTGLDVELKNEKGEVSKVVPGRKTWAPCVVCKKDCYSFAIVGLQEVEYQLCEEHLNRATLEKIHPRYEVKTQP